MASDEPLDDLRSRIDAIDRQLQDLLIARTDLALEIGRAKGGALAAGQGAKRHPMRPGREAAVLRRLIARHRGAFPRPVLVRIWREIIGALTALQGPLSVAVLAGPKSAELRALAREHYGSQVPVALAESPLGVLRAVSDGAATVGVLPLPLGEEAEPWWQALARSGEPSLKVIARLPFAALDPQRFHGPEALVVAAFEPEESGLDRSLLVLELDAPVSRSALREQIAAFGLELSDLQVMEQTQGRLHLIEVVGFLSEGDPRLASLEGLGGASGTLWWVGGYAVPLSVEQLLDAKEPAE